MLVGVRPSETSLARTEIETAAVPIADASSAPGTLTGAPHPSASVPSLDDARPAADAVTSDDELRSAATPARTIRDDLAALVARAVREGDLDLATRLIEVVRAQRPAAAGVVDLAAERARRGDR
jgi:hypothetical protein